MVLEKLKLLKTNILTSGLTFEEGDQNRFRVIILNSIFIFGLVYVITYSISAFLATGNLKQGINYGTAIIILILIYGLRKTGKVDLFINIFLTFASGVIVYMLTVNFNIGTIRLAYLLPIIVFFFGSRYKSFVFITLFIFFIPFSMSIYYLRNLNASPPFDQQPFIYMMIDVCIISFLMFVYRYVIDSKEAVLSKKKNEIQASNSKLAEEIKARKAADIKLKEEAKILDEQNQELSKLNQMMVDREIKMVEVKKENQRLKEELEKLRPTLNQ